MTKRRSAMWTVVAALVWTSCAAPPIAGTGSAEDPASSDGDTAPDETPAEDGDSEPGDGDVSPQDGTDQGDGTDDPGGQEGGAFPFPQNRSFAHCTALDVGGDGTRAAYERFHSEAVVAEGAGGFLRVRRWEDGDDTVSEGIAYGMLAAVYMNDRTTFDALWKYSQLHTNSNGFMHWRVNAAGVEIDHTGSAIGYDQRGGATDADEDIAWALLMAHYQWGGRGSLDGDYLALAKDLIDRIWRHEVDHGGGEVLKPGDRWGGYSVTNPSYFAPAYYRVFGRITGNEGAWQKVVDSSYAILAKSAHPVTGLVPAWCNGEGQNANMDFTYQYDACRTPYRVALDYCLFGEARAESYLRKVGNFFRNLGASGIGDGYALDGRELSQNRSMAFIGPAGAAGLAVPELASFATDVYTELLVLGTRGTNEGYSYYNSSWGVLSLLFMTGNFLDYSSNK